MKYCLFIVLLSMSFRSVAQLSDAAIHDLKTGRVKRDTSFIYYLPYELGKKPLFIQGANSTMSHKDELSFDFKMKKGTTIRAARTGRVIEVKEDSQEGGLNKKYYHSGNHIIIEHEDGSQAMYWHLAYQGVLVTQGDWVKGGQEIGTSGHTGYSAFPHLHFQVIDVNKREILPRFYTKNGVRYLRPGRRYKSVGARPITYTK